MAGKLKYLSRHESIRLKRLLSFCESSLNILYHKRL